MQKTKCLKCLLSIAVLLIFCININGCSTLAIPTPNDIVDKPLGTETIKIGMSKKHVESLWGKPNQISMVENKEKWSSPREVWIYTPNLSLPINAGYLAKTQKLYFDGENLTDISE